MHPWIFQACNDEDGFNPVTLRALKTTDTLDDLMDILEGKHVRASWSHAEMLNMDERRDQAEAIRRMQGGAHL